MALRFGGVAGGNRLSLRRSILAPGFAQGLSVRTGGITAQVFGEVGYRVEFGAAAIHIGRDNDLAATTVGVRGSTQLFAELPVTLTGLVGWRQTGFLVASVPINRDAMVAQAGLDWAFSPVATLGVSYTGQAGERAQDHAVKGNFTYRF